MRILFRLMVVLIGTLSFAGIVSAAVPLVDPPPLAIAPGTETKQIVRAIKQALAGREWRVVNDQQGKIDATINVRNKHTADIQISYDAAQISIKYISSTNLDYVVRDGAPTIHRNYPRWIQFLTEDISRNLAVASID